MAEEIFDDEPESKKYRNENTQYSIVGDKFYPARETVGKLPSGYYTIGWDNNQQSHFLRKRDIIADDILILPDKNFESVICDIKKFWNNKNSYKKYNYVYKRGILLYGTHGCGKSSLIQLVCKDLIKYHNGIVINVSDSDDVMWFDDIVNIIREIEPQKPIIAVIEDIDNLTAEKEVLSLLLNILDGNLKTDNIVTIATTNYPEDLEERIKSRPSRFDRRYEIGIPNDEIRRFYIQHKLKEDDLKKVDIEEWIKETKGFTLDHLKELLLSVFVLNYDFKEALLDVKAMLNGKTLKATKVGEKTIGFNN